MDIDGVYYCSRCMRKLDQEEIICPHCGYDAASAQVSSQHLEEGTFLNDRYLLGAVIGAGGFGVTYAAWDENLSVPVAIKEYFPVKYAHRNVAESDEILPHEEGRAPFALGLSRFRREAQVLAQFQNVPGIVNINECFDENGTAYIAMEFVHGVPLDVYVRERKPTPRKLLEIMLPAINALETIHRQGVNHRDVKPENLLVQEDGSIKLIDFGSAREVEHVTNLIIVSDGYAALEQYDPRQPQGPFVDVYGVSATIYHMLTGVMPDAAISRAKHDKLKKPTRLGVRLKKYQEDALMAGLAVDPQKRIQSIAEFRSRLYNMPLPEEVRRRKAFVRRVIAVAVLTLLLMAAAFVNFAIGFPLGEGLLYSLRPDGWHVVGVAEERPEVTVPATRAAIPVTSIGVQTFRDNSTLETLVIPGSVKEIRPQSLADCTALKMVTLGDGVEQIGYLAFSGCTALHTVYLPESIDSIEPSAFDGTSDFLSAWCTRDINFDEVMTIDKDDRVFYRRKAVDGVPLQDLYGLYRQVNSLHQRTSDHTGKTGKRLFLHFPYLYGWEKNETGVTLKWFAYDDWACFEDTSNSYRLLHPFRSGAVILPSYIDGQPVTDVKQNVLDTMFTNEYYVMTSIDAVIFPYYMQSIRRWSDGKLLNEQIETFYSDEVQIIEDRAFYNARINTFDFPAKLKVIGEEAFAESTIVEVVLPDSVEEMGELAFYNCEHLKRATLSSGLKVIPESAFYSCGGLESVWIPEGVETVDQEAFSYCRALRFLWLPESLRQISNDLCSQSGMQYLYVPSGAELSAGAFDGMEGIIAGYAGSAAETLANKKRLRFEDVSRWNVLPDPDRPGCVTINANVVTDAVCASFDRENNMPVTTVNTYVTQEDPHIPEKDPMRRWWIQNKEQSYYTNDVSLKSAELPLLTEIIERDAFANTDEMSDIVLPSTVRMISKGAFENSAVKVVTLSAELDPSLSRLQYAFRGCSGLSFVIPDGVTRIEDGEFENCAYLTGVTIPEGVTDIGWAAFADCTTLTGVVLPQSLTSIDGEAFSSCRALTAITLPAGVISIGECAFWNCSALTDVTIPASVTSIGEGAFDDCHPDLVIRVLKNSPAEQYCKNNNLRYVYIATPSGT